MSSNIKWTYESIPDDEDRVLDDMEMEKSTDIFYRTKIKYIMSAVVVGILILSTILLGNLLDNSDKEEEPTFQYTFKRAGYEPLDHFPTNGNTFTYEILKHHIGVVEPGAPMKIHFFGTDPISVQYKVCPDGEHKSCLTGTYQHEFGEETASVFQFECVQLSTFSVDIQVRSRSGAMLYKGSSTAICMSVRREIRSLLPEDQDRYYQATYLLHTTSMENGKELYGENFVNADYMLRWHYFSAGQQDADHLHGGNGFLPQHLIITNMYEQALQVIDSSMALPYWDFTIDAADGIDVMTNSYAMRRGTFGAMARPKNLKMGFTYKQDHIIDGRIWNSMFANFTVGMNTEYTEMKSGYGYMRSPWNLNPSPYVSRFQHGLDVSHKELPTCEDHFDILQYNNQVESFYDAENDPHGNLHLMTGGIFGCDVFSVLFDDGILTTKKGFDGYVCIVWPLMTKFLWRYNSIEISKNCEIAENIDESYCPVYCLDEPHIRDSITYFFSDKVDYGDWQTLEDAIVKLICTNKTKSAVDGEEGATEEDDSTIAAGTKVITGDMTESASPADPVFWFIHPTLERIFHYKYAIGGFAETYWPTDPIAEFVCTSPLCYNVTQGGMDYWEDCCLGHFPVDSLMDPDHNDRTRKIGPTNKNVVEAVASVSSVNYSLPYIYDSFQWDHCTEQDFVAYGKKHFIDMLKYRQHTEDKAHTYEKQRAAARVAEHYEKYTTTTTTSPPPPTVVKSQSLTNDSPMVSPLSASASPSRLRSRSTATRRITTDDKLSGDDGGRNGIKSSSSASVGRYAHRKLEEAQELTGLKATTLQKARREWKEKSKGFPIPYQVVEPFPSHQGA